AGRVGAPGPGPRPGARQLCRRTDLPGRARRLPARPRRRRAGGMTIGFLAWFYPWTKAFHIISVVAGSVKKLYRSIYRASTSVISTWRLAGERAFKVMQRPLLRQVAMIHNALSQIGALSDSMATMFCKLC